VEIFDLEVVDGGWLAVDFDLFKFDTWPSTGDDGSSDAQFASGGEALVLDVEGMLLGALDLVAIGEGENKRRFDLALEQALDRLRFGLAGCFIARQHLVADLELLDGSGCAIS